MTALVDAAQTALLLLLLGVTVLLWLRARASRRKLLELQSSDGLRAGMVSDLAGAASTSFSRIEALHSELVEAQAQHSAWRTELEQRLADDRAAARASAAASQAVAQQLRNDVDDLRNGLSAALGSASMAREEDRRRQAMADQELARVNDQLRGLEGRMGDFLHGCDELVRAEIAAQLADALPMLGDPAKT